MFLHAVFLVLAGAVEVLVEVPGRVRRGRERGDQEAGIGLGCAGAGQRLDLGDHPALAGPARPDAVAERAEPA